MGWNSAHVISGKSRRYTYIDYTVAGAVPLDMNRGAKQIRAAILVLGGDEHVWGALRRQADMLQG